MINIIKKIVRFVRIHKLHFPSAAITASVIVLSFAGIILLWIYTNSKSDYLYAGREQTRILISSWNSLEKEAFDVLARPVSDTNTSKSAYNLVIFDIRLNGFLKSPLAEKLTQTSAPLKKRFDDVYAEWLSLSGKIESHLARTDVPALPESETASSRLRFSVLLEGMADAISDRIIQLTIQLRLIVFALSIVIIASTVFLISQIQKILYPDPHKLDELVDKRTTEIEAARAEAENAKMQAERINRQLQASVNHANLMAQQAMESNWSKHEFLTHMSREIRIPMNAIIGFSEMLVEENLTEQQKKQVGMIRDSSWHLLQLINDILDISRIETGKLDLENTNCSIENILTMIDSLMRPAAAAKKLQFEIIRNKSLPEFIRTDSARLKQCLINLISNAIESADKGSICVKVSSVKNNDKFFIRFDVEYPTAGISPDRHSRALEPFPQADAVGVHKLNGNSLKLALTRHLADILGGFVTVGSTANKGVFSLVMPMGAPQVQTAQGGASGGILPAGPMENIRLTGKVLVAEDTLTNQVLIELLLKKLGLETVIVENGRLAVEKAAAEKFDLILMDMQMPVMNGYEAIKQLRQQGIKTPIIAQTAFAMKGDDEKCLSAGCDDYISKPIDRKKLVEILARYLPAGNKGQAEKTTQPEPQDRAQNTENGRSAPNGTEINWQLLVENIGNEELIDEIMPAFTRDNKGKIETLSQAVANNDEKEIKFYAHTIKGAAGTIGAVAVAELARQLETAARDSDTSKYKPLFEELKARFARLTEFLSKSDWKQIAALRQSSKKA